MSRWISPITDRTLDDVLLRTQKAFFNVADWQRIRGNTEQAQELARLLLSIEVALHALAAPAITSFPQVGQINALIADIDQLREAIRMPAGVGLVTLRYDYVAGNGAVAPDYEDANDWEQDLLLIRDLLARAADHLVYCGVGAVGQPRFWQGRFRAWQYVPEDPDFVRAPRCGLSVAGSPLTRNNAFRRYAA